MTVTDETQLDATPVGDLADVPETEPLRQRRSRRLSLSRRRAESPADVTGALRFDEPGGPIVAVCGLTGGAGTTTIAWWLARRAARESGAPILLGELPGASGGLAALGGPAESRSLGRLMADAATGRLERPSLTQGPDGLRVLGSEPELPAELAPDARPDALDRVLGSLRPEHGLTVVDCGPLNSVDARAAVAVATHVVWTVPATRPAATRARALLTTSAQAPPAGDVTELLVVSATTPRSGPARVERDLRALAADRCERLVLVPHVRELARRSPGRAAEQRLALALAAIAGALRQERPS